MSRRMLDFVLSAAGATLAVVLLVAGGLLFWGYRFADGSVRTQLAAQRIYFPPRGSEALADPRIAPYLTRYAGEQLVTGEQARAYADHFIAVHLKEVAGGKTYAEVSAAALQNPDDAKLQAQAQTLFRGETLRGLLLNAYAWWKMGQLALIGSVVSFVLGGLMVILSILGFWHLRRVPPTEQVFAELLEARGRAA